MNNCSCKKQLHLQPRRSNTVRSEEIPDQRQWMASLHIQWLLAMTSGSYPKHPKSAKQTTQIHCPVATNYKSNQTSTLRLIGIQSFHQTKQCRKRSRNKKRGRNSWIDPLNYQDLAPYGGCCLAHSVINRLQKLMVKFKEEQQPLWRPRSDKVHP